MTTVFVVNSGSSSIKWELLDVESASVEAGGIVAILDPRVVSRAYGRHLLDALPSGLPRTSSIEQARRWWRGPQPATPPAIT